MISVVVYGRNDDYGYNLHKRAAMSLNCIAAVLTDDDEILFVDYNTPDEFPTFPEAIRDTLTPTARRSIRVLRVRESVHRERFADLTHLAAVEPVARNVAVRRADPRNRWILSTNTDMVFLTHSGRSLTEEVGRLEDGFYCAPRVELPEAVWEAFDRRDPEATMHDLRTLRRSLHLDEIVHGPPAARYDAPGDFQLALREDLLSVGGFNERMLKGWHVDSNLSARLLLARGTVGDAADFVLGYHCDHLRKLTPAHRSGAVENDLASFVDEVVTPDLPGNGADWGLADVDIEELRLESAGPTWIARLERQLQPPLDVPYVGSICPAVPDSVPAPARHILPYLASVIGPYPRNLAALWIGPEDELFELVTEHWTGAGFTRPIISYADVPTDAPRDESRIVFVSFGSPALVEGRVASELLDQFSGLVVEELEAVLAGERPSRVILMNGIYNRFESVVRNAFDIGRSPFSTRLSVGAIRPDAVPPIIAASIRFSVLELTAALVPGPAGRWGPSTSARPAARPAAVVARRGARGHVGIGAFATLPAGDYQAEVEVILAPSVTVGIPRAYVDVAIAGRPIAARGMAAPQLPGRRRIIVAFRLDPDEGGQKVEIRLHSNGRLHIRIRAVRIRRLS